MKMNKKGDGSTRQLSDGSWECVIQSKYLNPKTGNPKRIKRKGKTEEEATSNARLALNAWEKEIKDGRDIKIDRSKTFGKYMEEYIEEEVKHNLTASAYLSYVCAMKNNFYSFYIAKLQLQMLNAREYPKVCVNLQTGVR